LAAAAAPLPLTSREREIVTLAARGLTNRQIAEWLVVSVRTVEGHLYRACAKLGTTNRADLATLLPPTGDLSAPRHSPSSHRNPTATE
jgi:DNA-binding NarL/FixJ family response regulator